MEPYNPNKPFIQMKLEGSLLDRMVEAGIPFTRALQYFRDNQEGPASEFFKLAAEDVIPFYGNYRNGGSASDYAKEAIMLAAPAPKGSTGPRNKVSVDRKRTDRINKEIAEYIESDANKQNKGTHRYVSDALADERLQRYRAKYLDALKNVPGSNNWFNDIIISNTDNPYKKVVTDPAKALELQREASRIQGYLDEINNSRNSSIQSSYNNPIEIENIRQARDTYNQYFHEPEMNQLLSDSYEYKFNPDPSVNYRYTVGDYDNYVNGPAGKAEISKQRAIDVEKELGLSDANLRKAYPNNPEIVDYYIKIRDAINNDRLTPQERAEIIEALYNYGDALRSIEDLP